MFVEAEKQVHEEVAKRRGGLQRPGGGGGLPGRSVCGVCSSAASCDAGSADRSSRSHKVADIQQLSLNRIRSYNFIFTLILPLSFNFTQAIRNQTEAFNYKMFSPSLI